jgi:phospho-N-acetylmuramoyl-pentapeptide-transferase
MTEAGIAFIVAALVAILTGQKIIHVLMKLNFRQTVSEDVPKHHLLKTGTPIMGGLIILLGALCGSLVGGVADKRVFAVVVMMVGFAALGFIDDYLIASRGRSLGLKARQKLAVQFLFAICFVAWVHRNLSQPTLVLPLQGKHAIDFGWSFYPLAVLFIVGMSNAVNLTDGLDGLVAGLMVAVGLTLGILVFGYASGLTVLSWALAGGCLGFLWHNSHPAKVFMGDTGSLALGAAIAGIALVSRREIPALIVVAVFVIEALSVIIQVVSFKTTGRRVFKMTPIHHHFEKCGLPEEKIVVGFWIVQVLISLTVLTWLGVLKVWS